MIHVGCTEQTCLLSLVSCLLAPVSCLLSAVSCLLAPVSISVSCLYLCLLSPVSCLLSLSLSPVACLLSVVSCFMSPVFCLLSAVSCFLSPVSVSFSCFLAPVSCLSQVIGRLSATDRDEQVAYFHYSLVNPSDNFTITKSTYLSPCRALIPSGLLWLVHLVHSFFISME